MSTGRVPTPPPPPSGTPNPFSSFAGQQPYPQFVMNGATFAAVVAAIKLAKPGGVDQILIAPSSRTGWTNAPGGNAVLIGLLLPAVQALRSPGSWSSPDVQGLGGCLKPGGKAGVLSNDSLSLVFSPIVWFPVTPSAPPPPPPSPFAAYNGQSYYPQTLIFPQGQPDDLSRVVAAVHAAKPGGVAQIVIAPSMRLGWTFVAGPNAILIGMLVPAIQAVRASTGWNSPAMMSAKQCLAGGGKLGVLGTDNYNLDFSAIVWCT